MSSREPYKLEAHGPWITSGGKKWCFSCGLIALNNRASDWCVEKGCRYKDHVAYSSSMKRLTKHQKGSD